MLSFTWGTGATAIVVALIGAASATLATVLGIRAARAAEEAKRVAQDSADEAERRADEAKRIEQEHYETVHGLVNSTLSRSMQSDLDVSVHAAALLRENIALNRGNGVEPTDDSNAALVLLDAKIVQLGKDIQDRNTEAMNFATRPR